MSRLVRYDRDGDVGIITIDNPPVNALSEPVLRLLQEFVETIKNDRDVRAIVLASTGSRVFVAGADISEFSKMQQQHGAMESRMQQTRCLFDDLASLPVPIIAAVSGAAIGGGLELVLVSDFVIAEAGVRLGLVETTLGLIPGAGGTQRLTRRIGELRSKDMILTGRTIDAQTGVQYGLITTVVPENEALSASVKLAEKLAEMPGFAIQIAKGLISKGTSGGLAEGLDLEARGFLETFKSQDALEGVSAFEQKRKPIFHHR